MQENPDTKLLWFPVLLIKLQKELKEKKIAERKEKG